MPDDTTAAIQALLQQVTALTETVTAQQKRLDDLHAFNGRILDEAKDLKREKKSLLQIVEEQQRDRALANANLTRDADGNLRLNSSALPAHTISRADARDPAKYRAAKEAAARAGVSLRIADDRDDPTRRNTRGQPEVIKSRTVTFDDEHERIRYVRADMQTGAGIVQRRAAAEKDGYSIRTFRTLDDLPEHARTKFILMEKSHEAG
jgi:septal ring factor EnvC (AmiA/AmiB activator)